MWVSAHKEAGEPGSPLPRTSPASDTPSYHRQGFGNSRSGLPSMKTCPLLRRIQPARSASDGNHFSRLFHPFVNLTPNC